MLNKYGIIIILIAFTYSCGHTIKNDASKEVGNSNDTTFTKYANLVLIEDFFDFGSIVQGEVVSHTFHFKNGGNDTMRIRDLVPDCGCTQPKIEKMVYAPGEEGTVEITFNSTEWQGSQYKSVSFSTNSPIKKKSVTIKANVVPPKN